MGGREGKRKGKEGGEKEIEDSPELLVHNRTK